jgi:hypothetical protein
MVVEPGSMHGVTISMSDSGSVIESSSSSETVDAVVRVGGVDTDGVMISMSDSGLVMESAPSVVRIFGGTAVDTILAKLSI